jgi:hypothetical protein
MLVIRQFSFLFQSHGTQFDEVHACILWDVIDCHTLGIILLGDDVDEHSKFGYGMAITPTI